MTALSPKFELTDQPDQESLRFHIGTLENRIPEIAKCDLKSHTHFYSLVLNY